MSMHEDKHPQKQQQNGKRNHAHQKQAVRARLCLTGLSSSSHVKSNDEA
jgi:hypothetical protein